MNSDTVFLRGLRLRGKHGVHQHERESEQDFLIDVSAVFDTRSAAASDELSDALDYGTFKSIAEDVVGNNSFYLIERLASTIAERILEDERIDSVSVTVRKPSVYANAEPGISITRTRT